jgi:hypothetical protein
MPTADDVVVGPPMSFPPRERCPPGGQVIMDRAVGSEVGDVLVDPADIDLPPTQPIDITPFLTGAAG